MIFHITVTLSLICNHMHSGVNCVYTAYSLAALIGTAWISRRLPSQIAWYVTRLGCGMRAAASGEREQSFWVTCFSAWIKWKAGASNQRSDKKAEQRSMEAHRCTPREIWSTASSNTAKEEGWSQEAKNSVCQLYLLTAHSLILWWHSGYEAGTVASLNKTQNNPPTAIARIAREKAAQDNQDAHELAGQMSDLNKQYHK